jgi:hypothetical protein
LFRNNALTRTRRSQASYWSLELAPAAGGMIGLTLLINEPKFLQILISLLKTIRPSRAAKAEYS